MPEDPTDDFSQLPKADGAGHFSPETWQPAAKRTRTRIGRRQEDSEQITPESPSEPTLPEQPQEEPPPEISNEWNDLLQEPRLTETSPYSNADWQEVSLPEETPVPQQPRRTVIKRPESRQESTDLATTEKAEPPTRGSQKQPHIESTKISDPTEETAPPPAESRGPLRQWWDKVGGKALTFSLIIHGAVLLSATYFVVTRVIEPEKTEFLPGGGTQQGAAAAEALEHKVQIKKSSWLKEATPIRKIAAVGAISDIQLSDEMPDLPKSDNLLNQTKLTGSLGLGSMGSPLSQGVGMGNQSGITFQPFSLFGMEIKARKLAVVLDVSTSMAPHLPRVIQEIDKVAKGSMVILHFGCGLEAPPRGGVTGDDLYPTSSTDFEKFWRMGGGTLAETRSFRINPKDFIPSEDVFRLLARRPNTYFIHITSLGNTWLALLNDRVRTVDGIYWFSDFQDRVEFQQMMVVKENLARRKQRLYIHAYMHGASYDQVRALLAEPSGGGAKVEE